MTQELSKQREQARQPKRRNRVRLHMSFWEVALIMHRFSKLDPEDMTDTDWAELALLQMLTRYRVTMMELGMRCIGVFMFIFLHYTFLVIPPAMLETELGLELAMARAYLIMAVAVIWSVLSLGLGYVLAKRWPDTERLYAAIDAAIRRVGVEFEVPSLERLITRIWSAAMLVAIVSALIFKAQGETLSAGLAVIMNILMMLSTALHTMSVSYMRRSVVEGLAQRDEDE